MREILFRGRRRNGEWIEGNYIFWNKKHCIYDGIYYEVLPETIGQYTGLCDKNGKRIFEGDVAKNIDGAFLVCWDKEKCAFIMRFLEYPYETLYLEEMWEDSEIIGNIHDNPELLKGGAE